MTVEENVGAAVECWTFNRESLGSNPICYRFKVWAFYSLHDPPGHMRYIKTYLYLLMLPVAVAAFAEEVSGAHEQFANQIKNIVESFLKRSDEHKKEM